MIISCFRNNSLSKLHPFPLWSIQHWRMRDFHIPARQLSFSIPGQVWKHSQKKGLVLCITGNNNVWFVSGKEGNTLGGIGKLGHRCRGWERTSPHSLRECLLNASDVRDTGLGPGGRALGKSKSLLSRNVKSRVRHGHQSNYSNVQSLHCSVPNDINSQTIRSYPKAGRKTHSKREH